MLRSTAAFRSALRSGTSALRVASVATTAVTAPNATAKFSLASTSNAFTNKLSLVAAPARFNSTAAAPVVPPVAPAAATEPAAAAAAAAATTEPPKPKLSLRQRWRAARAESSFRQFFPRNFYRYTAFSFAGFYALNAVTEHWVDLLRDLHVPASIIESAVYHEGALHALAVVALIKGGAHVLSLGGKPSERVIQEIMNACAQRPAVQAALGPNVRVGVLSTYAYTDNALRVRNSRRREAEKWASLATLGELTEPAPVPLWRRIFRRAAKKGAANLTPNGSVTGTAVVTAVDDVNVSVTQKMSDISVALPGAPEELIAATTAAAAVKANAATAATAEATDAAEATKTAAAADATTTANTDAAAAATAIDPATGMPVALKERFAGQAQRAKDHAVDYSGWGRIWKARRVQVVMHVIGDTDSALLLAEVEKKHTGWSDLYQVRHL